VNLEQQFRGSAAGLMTYLSDPEVTDILINGFHSLYIERAGQLQVAPNPFADAESLHDLIERMVVPLGRRIDAKQPYLDGSLCDGSRFHVILPPIASGGACISIRKFGRHHAPLSGFGNGEATGLLIDAVHRKHNVLIAGGTGSGKTTLLSALLNLVDPAERIALLEESREAQTDHPHVVRLEARPAGPEGVGEVTLRDLVRNALRMRPDRIVVGECRGAEAFEMLQAMSTGHPGSLTTLHANSAAAALKRLEQLVLLSGLELPQRAVREWVSTCVDTVVFLKRRGPVRSVVEIVQVQGLEGEVYRVLPRFQAPG
jgi:pilus assembly protein CpaF